MEHNENEKKMQYVFKEFLPESIETPFPLTVYFNVYSVSKDSNNKNGNEECAKEMMLSQLFFSFSCG